MKTSTVYALAVALLALSACRATEREEAAAPELSVVLVPLEQAELETAQPGVSFDDLPAEARGRSRRLRVAKAEVGHNHLGWPAPLLRIHPEDQALLRRLTERHVGQHMAMVAGGSCSWWPSLRLPSTARSSCHWATS